MRRMLAHEHLYANARLLQQTDDLARFICSSATRSADKRAACLPSGTKVPHPLFFLSQIASKRAYLGHSATSSTPLRNPWTKEKRHAANAGNSAIELLDAQAIEALGRLIVGIDNG